MLSGLTLIALWAPRREEEGEKRRGEERKGKERRGEEKRTRGEEVVGRARVYERLEEGGRYELWLILHFSFFLSFS